MNTLTWWHIARIFVYLIVFLIFVVWLEWIAKGKKIVKEDQLETFAVGYGILKEKGSGKEQTISIISGLLGENSSEVVFGSRPDNEALHLKTKLHKISRFDVLDTHDDGFQKFMHSGEGDEKIATNYVTKNMAGISEGKRVPKFINSRRVFKISLISGEKFYFCYKNTKKNAHAIEKLKSHVYSA